MKTQLLKIKAMSSLSAPFFFFWLGCILQAKDPRSQTTWSRIELEAWQVGGTSQVMPTCANYPDCSLYFSAIDKVFSTAPMVVPRVQFCYKNCESQSCILRVETVRDLETSLVTGSQESLMDGSFLYTLITQCQHMLLSKQLLFMDWCSEVKLQLSGMYPISKQIYTGVTAAFQIQDCFADQRSAM